MADYQLPSFGQLQEMSADPRTAALAEVPNALQGSLGLAEVLQQKQLERRQKEQALKQAIEQHMNEVKLGKAAAVTPNTPVSSAVPQANIGNIAAAPQVPSAGFQPNEQPVTGEQQSKSDIQGLLAATEPKEYAKAVLKNEYRPTPKPNAEYSPVSGVLSKNGKPLVIDKFTGEIKESGPEAKQKDTLSSYAAVRKAGLEQHILDNIVPGMSKNKVVKDSANILFQDQRLQALNEFAQGNPTPQETREITIAFDRILRGGGAVPVTEIKALAPRSAIASGASLWQWITAQPTGTGQQALIKRLVTASSRESRVAQKNINQQLERMGSAIAPEFKHDPEFMKILSNSIAQQSQLDDRTQADLSTKSPEDSLKDVSAQLDDINAQIAALEGK